jgi:molybdate transport system substrate-binding protein
MQFLRATILACALLCAGIAPGAEPAEPLVVFAAASLTDALGEIGNEFTRETGIQIKTSFAASSALAKQIESGAPVGVFFSADEKWMNYLEERKLLTAGTRRDVLANKLVVVVPSDSTVTALKLDSGAALLAAFGKEHVATGDPDSVPVGKYAKAALTKLGAWKQIAPQLVRAENVRSALAFVARGEAAFGIVYLTDAKVEKKVKLVGTFPAETHPPIRYPIAVTAKGDANARRFVTFVSSKQASAIFEKYGFSLAQ